MERFAQFEIVKPLGVGGMAETALAIRRGHDEFEQRVCLKRILPAFNKDPEFVRAFQNEAKLGLRLVHPHVCRLYDFGSHDGTFWMTMEYLDGGDLRSLLESVETLGQPLPTDVVLLLALDIASALHYAHELRVDGRPMEIVHRDISPSNVLIDSTGHFKLADFGIAKGKGGEVTRSGVVKGKIPYMAPEHARGMKIDARADLWSFGVMLYESLAGQRPFRGSHEVETLLAVTEGRRKKLLEVAPHTPPVLAEVVEKLLEPDIEKRTRRAADVIEALAATPPPANARLRLSALIQRVQDELAQTDQRAVAEAATAFAPDGATKAAPEPTVMAKDGVAIAGAPQPVSASPHAETRNATPILPAMETAAIPASARPRATEAEMPAPSVSVRSAEALPSSNSHASLSGIDAAGQPSVTDTDAVPVGPPIAVKRTAQAVIAFAAIGTIGLGLAAWGLTGPSGAEVSSPAASIGAAPAAPPVHSVPSTATPPAIPAPSEPAEAPAAVIPIAVPTEVPSAPPSEAPPVASEAPPVAPVPSEPAVLAGGDGDTAADEARTRGTLVMAATPWGNIWLDGRRLGMGPITRRVAPGRHVVGAGRDRATTTRTVHVDAGGRIEVALRVTE